MLAICSVASVSIIFALCRLVSASRHGVAFDVSGAVRSIRRMACKRFLRRANPINTAELVRELLV
ncbi:hypothetical protein [Blastochloris sulfoviridis]|uniref:Uncharacterized protein n=1 Tax=Blastochloris sulfoviridis TaxID=50712 RepID=A0A5M6I1H0_9HYPH|nr:hypothetical protein [Blastochloris sulfoviridis]KAA5602030.1 hypothetical protein F1193_07760 [Blastochloris sulfoviridis]